MDDQANFQNTFYEANNLLVKARQAYKLKNYEKIIHNCEHILTLLEQSLSQKPELHLVQKEVLEILFTTWLWMGRAYHRLGEEKSSQHCFDKEKYFLIKLYETK